MNQKKKVGRPPEHRDNILKKISIDGKQTTNSLKQSFDKERLKEVHPNSIIRELNSMEANELIDVKTVESHQHGKPTVYYDITNKGLEEYITKTKPKVNEFLKILKMRNNESTNYITKLEQSKDGKQTKNENITNEKRKVGFKLTKTFQFYEEYILNVKREYWIPKFFQNYLNDKDYFSSNITIHEEYFDKSGIRKNILEIISLSKTITFEKLIQLLDIEKIKQSQNKTIELSYENPKKGKLWTKLEVENKITDLIHELTSKNIIHKISKNNKDVYDLTHLGLIDLLLSLYNDAQNTGNLVNGQFRYDSLSNRFNSLIKKTINRFSYLLPEIFNNIEKIGIKPYQIGLILIGSSLELHIDKSRMSHPGNVRSRLNDILNGNIKPLEIRVFFQNSRQKTYDEKLKLFYDDTNKILPVRIITNDCEKSFDYDKCEKYIKNRILIDFIYLYKLAFPKESNIFLQNNDEMNKMFSDYNKELKTFIDENLEQVINV